MARGMPRDMTHDAAHDTGFDASYDMPLRGRRRRGAQGPAVLSRQEIERILFESGGNHSIAARRLGISRTTLWRKLRPLSS